MAMKTKGRFGSISKDFFYNILASVILTGVMQVVVYPFLALKFNNQEYGTLLTIMGIANTVIVAFGNTLNNVRLIVNNDYEREQQSLFQAINYHRNWFGSLCCSGNGKILLLCGIPIDSRF